LDTIIAQKSRKFKRIAYNDNLNQNSGSTKYFSTRQDLSVLFSKEFFEYFCETVFGDYFAVQFPPQLAFFVKFYSYRNASSADILVARCAG